MRSEIYEKLTIPTEHRLTAVAKEEAVFMHDLLVEKQAVSTLETGFAYGCSAAHIIAATHAEHYAIDPCPEAFGHLGMHNIRQLGFDGLLKLERDFSHNVLPKLVGEGKKFDFVFIDGDHKYDGIFVDFYYADLLLNQSGYVLFHDHWMKATQMVCSWIDTNKSNYRRLGTPCHNLVLYQKQGTDERNWDHYIAFGIKTDAFITRRLQKLVRHVRGLFRGKKP